MFGLSHSVEVALAVASLVIFVGTIVAIPIFLVKVPADYFVRPRRARPMPVRVLRTLVGLALIALGVAMIVLPGQGILTILVGLGILDMPIKDRIIRRILCTPKVHAAVDALRRKAGKGSLLVPGSCAGPVVA
jgi:hypothetical protein